MRGKLGRMKRIGIEISAAGYDFVTICYDLLRFSIFVTNRYDFVTISNPFHPTRFRRCVFFICIYRESNLVGGNGLEYKSQLRFSLRFCYDFPISWQFSNFVTIRYDFTTSLRFRYDSQSVSSDQVSPFFFLHDYIEWETWADETDRNRNLGSLLRLAVRQDIIDAMAAII